MRGVQPINRRPFTSTNAGWSPSLSSDSCEETARRVLSLALGLAKNLLIAGPQTGFDLASHLLFAAAASAALVARSDVVRICSLYVARLFVTLPS